MNTSDGPDARTRILTEEITRAAAEIFGRLPGADFGLPVEPAAAPALHANVPGGALGPTSPVLLPALPLGQLPSTTPPPGLGPSALNLGAGGVSAGQTLPPLPGSIQQPPLTSAPPPKESDLRNLLTTVPQSFGFPSLALVGAAPAVPSATPYFLDLAGPPATTSHPPLASAGVPGEATWFEPIVPAGRPSVEALGPDLHQTRPTLVPERPTDTRLFDPTSIKADFPILRERVHGRALIWLDNAATTQKPQAVIDRISYFYEHENSNVHRAAHAMAARATDAYEAAREKVRRFLNAPSSKEIVFARGATEAINLVAKSWGRRNVRAGDEILITWLEHHANIVPWQQLCAETGARLCVAPVDERGEVILEEYEKLVGPKTRLVSIAHVSNALGTIVPVQEMVAIAHRQGAVALVDGAQAVSHMRVDVQAIDCDFYCFSGHKVFAPTGIGVLFGKADVLDAMPPWQGGGNMIADVTFEKTTYQKAPLRFEAGTGSIGDAVGLGAAVDYLERLGLENVSRYEDELLHYATDELGRVPGLRMIGTAPAKAGVLSFVLAGAPTEKVGEALDREGIAVRSGHHCAQPILRRFGLESTVRASLAPYNTCEDIDALVAALLRIQARGGL